MIFHFSSFFILIKLYAPRKSSVINYFISQMRSYNFEINNNAYRFFIIILFSYQQLIYKRISLLDFKMNRTKYSVDKVED